MMAQPDRRFPTFDVWQALSESEQDALIAKIEHSRRRSDAFTSVLIAALVMALIGGVLYLASSFHF